MTTMLLLPLQLQTIMMFLAADTGNDNDNDDDAVVAAADDDSDLQHRALDAAAGVDGLDEEQGEVRDDGAVEESNDDDDGYDH